MPISYKTGAVGVVVITAVVVIGWWAGSGVDEASLQRVVTNDKSMRDDAVAIQPEQKKLNDIWQWTALTSPTGAGGSAAPGSETSVPNDQFDIVKIHAALKEIKLDDGGNIIPDHAALSALNEAFQYGNLIMDGRAMAAFQNIIMTALPAPAGEQAATIVSDFNDYLRAKKDMLAMMTAPGQGLDHEAGYDELVTLRDIYLGQAVAEQLFAKEDALSRHMMESLRIESDTTLSVEDKLIQQQFVSERYADAEVGVENWQLRYQQFLQDKQTITAAGYAPADMQIQIKDLLQYHFSKEELKQIAYMNLEAQ